MRTSRLSPLRAPCILLAATFATSGCGDLDDASNMRQTDPGQDGSDRPSPGDEPAPAPRLRAGAPAATERHLLVADEAGDTVTILEHRSLRSTTVAVASLPRHVRAVPGQERALILPLSIRALQRIDLDGPEPVVRTIPLPARCNQLTIAPDAAHAAIWDCGGTGQDGSEQEIVLVRLDDERVVMLSIRARADDLFFSADGEVLIVQTAAGLHRMEPHTIDTDRLAPTLPTEGWSATSSLIRSSDASSALVFGAIDDASGALLLDLAQGEVLALPAEAQPIVRAVASSGDDASWLIEREDGTLLVVQRGIEDGVDIDERGIRFDETAAFGWDGSTLVAAGRTDGLWSVQVDTGGTSSQSWPLRLEPVDVLLSPEEDRIVLVLHAGGERISLIRRDLGYVKLEELPGPLHRIVVTGGATPMVWCTAEHGTDGGALVRWDVGTLARSEFPLGGAPVELGALPGGSRVFAAVRHPLGRLVFASADSDAPRFVTGFGLNAQVE
jgi:hypothetical protein